MSFENTSPKIKEITFQKYPISARETDSKVYGRRYWILFLFTGLAFLCNFGFPQYVSMANVNTCYYGISNEALNWTVQMTMLFFIVLEIPLSFGINYVGLRWTVIAGSLANTAASALQFAGLKQDGFPFVLLSSVFTSASNILVNVLPPLVAATWFPSNELSRACATGLFGMQLGFAAGYPFAPLIISNNCSDISGIEEGKFKIATVLTTANVIWLILILLTFQGGPKFPPTGPLTEKMPPKTYARNFLSLLKNKNFILIQLVTGIMYGSFLALTTVLNNLILRYFPGKEVEIGWMGTLLMVSGLGGCMAAGFILDFTHRFRFFQLSIVTLAIEYGIEVTFPVPEIVSSSLLCVTTNAFGLMLTEASSRLLEEFGQSPFYIAVSSALFFSSIIPFFITTEYRRNQQNAKKSLQKQLTEENLCQTFQVSS